MWEHLLEVVDKTTYEIIDEAIEHLFHGYKEALLYSTFVGFPSELFWCKILILINLGFLVQAILFIFIIMKLTSAFKPPYPLHVWALVGTPALHKVSYNDKFL